jgi:phosphoenolpyruvate carboxylase
MEKDFNIKVDLSYDMSIDAETYEEAVSVVKDIFKQDNNIDLDDREIDKVSALHDFIERQANLWADLETIEQECLSGNETLVDWLQYELLEVVRLFKKGE